VPGNFVQTDGKNKKKKDHEKFMVFLVAGAGLEPATFGL